MLSIGKLSFSPSLEQTPKACSDNNNFNFSMEGDFDCSKLKKKVFEYTIYLTSRLFSFIILFFSLSSAVFGQMNSAKQGYRFISDVQLTPSKLKLEGDSVRFSIKGTIPNESLLMPRNPRLSLRLYSTGDTLDFGNISLVKEVANFSFGQSFSVVFQPWMEGAVLELNFFQGRKDQEVPFETKIVGRGISAPQLLVNLGQVIPGEPIPQIGLFQLTEGMNSKNKKIETFFPMFLPGTDQLTKNMFNRELFKKMSDFLKENPDVIQIKITGLQSPERVEGRNSQLGRKRAETALEELKQRFPDLDFPTIALDSRWNDWFDLRLFLESYDGISDEERIAFQSVLMGQENYLTKWELMKKMNGFGQISRNLFPRLRTAKIEIISKPIDRTTIDQLNPIGEESKNSENGNLRGFEQMALAAEAAETPEGKGQIYFRMTEKYRNALPYVNMAVIRMRQAQTVDDLSSKENLWEEADRLLNQAIQIEPENAFALHNQGQLLSLRGIYWEAYIKLSEASVLFQEPNLRQYNDLLRGALDILRGDFRLATLRFDSQISDPRALFNKGLAYYLSGNYEQATFAFEESAIKGRELGYGFYGLALIAAQSGQNEIAQNQLVKAIFFNKNLESKVIMEPNFQDLKVNFRELKKY